MQIIVEGFGVAVAVAGDTLLEALERAGVAVEAACGGFACCNTCRVLVLDDAGGLSEELPEERPFLDKDGQRLACQARVLGDVSLRLDPGA